MTYNHLHRAISEQCATFLLGKISKYNTSKAVIMIAATAIAAQATEKTRKFSTARLLHTYKLDSPEGTALLGLAEAFMRIPDKATKRLFLKDKLDGKKWDDKDFPVLTKALSLGGKIGSGVGSSIVIPTINKALDMFGKQFVLGQTMKEALKNRKGLISVDMLGEAAITTEDADRYFDLYKNAIEELPSNNGTLHEGDSVSVKLSALDPKFDYRYADYVVPRLISKIHTLTELAEKKNIPLTIDAEEADKLDITIKVLNGVMQYGHDNLGIAIQAYQKRAYDVVEYLANLTEEHNRKLAIRLVKGAYWDSEIKWAQEQGLDYPVFTIKELTDLSYIACVERIFECPNIYGQFATHNIHTVATVQQLGLEKDYELQRLHGMGEEVFDAVVDSFDIRMRVYAPVGKYKELLPYLVRRLLENGANTSFVSSFLEDDNIIIDPTEDITIYEHEMIDDPLDIYGHRLNSMGVDLSNQDTSKKIMDHIAHYKISEKPFGTVLYRATSEKHQQRWASIELDKRARILEKVSDLMEKNMHDLIALCVKEAKKTIPDSIGEIREAVDFLRYYAIQARETLAPTTQKGVTGEENTLSYEPKGLWLAISPWNFPVAIFTGQIAAALVCGNCVVAKPAEQTSRIAEYVVNLFYEAGLDKNVLTLFCGGADIGQMLVESESFAGISFTGGTDTAKVIATTQLQRNAPIGKLIAETGGINAMIVDSTALPEQAVKDVLYSAFNSAGQRCSALRILCLQEDIYDKVMKMLKGGIKQLIVGSPTQLQTDVGPIIDNEAVANIMEKSGIVQHIERNLFYPEIIEVSKIEDIKEEIFGPVLHVVKWKANELDDLVDSLNVMKFNLTLGIQTRIVSRMDYLSSKIKAGNVYINRNQVGAVVESQPFGGSRYSGTGPKAGGPNYLKSFVNEKTVSNNTTAIGGNTTLVMLK